VRSGNEVIELIDGPQAFVEMVRAIKTATTQDHFIYLLGWWLTDSFALLPGNSASTIDALLWNTGWITFQMGTGPTVTEANQRVKVAFPANSKDDPVQRFFGIPAFGAGCKSRYKLRVDFDVEVDYDLDTWPSSNGVRINRGQVVNTGVQVRAMLYDQPMTQNSAEVDHINALPNGAAILDSRHLNLGSHHQKVLIVNGSDGLIAFCGGIDINSDRLYQKGVGSNRNGDTEGAPFHDVHCRIKGPAAWDLLQIFVERWQDHPNHAALDTQKGQLRGTSMGIPQSIAGQTNWVQIGRTYGNGTRHGGIGRGGYQFAPNGEQTARQMFLHAIAQARKFIYIEDQYLVNYEAMEELIAALPNIQHLTVLIPHGSITLMGSPDGRAVRNQVNFRRREFIARLRRMGGEKVRVFYLVAQPMNQIKGLHTYVHSKTWIFDDQFAIIGSANCNRRSWTHDSEVVAGIYDQGDGTKLRFPHWLRMRLWAEHLNLDVSRDASRLTDGVASAALWLAGRRPAGARIATYDENRDIESSPSQADWDTIIDPDGS